MILTSEHCESAIRQVEIEKCMLRNGMLCGLEKDVVKYNIRKIELDSPWLFSYPGTGNNL